MSNGTQWLSNHAVTELWSGPDERAIAFTLVPQWSLFQPLAAQQGARIPVHYFGNSTAQAGDVWVDAEDLGPIEQPAAVTEPEWPPSIAAEPQPVQLASTYRPATAPPIRAAHIEPILRAARVAEVEPGLLAATAARESGFRDDAYRREAGLAFVRWREAPGQPLERFYDGSLGPCQVLRSNFLAFGIDSEREAYDLAANYRIAALIIRQNLAAFPNDRWKAVAAYNLGQYGARLGRIPAGDYTDTILRWADEYRPLFERPPVQPSTAAGLGDSLIAYGRTLLGTPYVFGGKSLERDTGLDCSGFVCEVLEHCGLRLGNRDFLSAEAIRQKARSVDERQPRVGDLLFFQGTYSTPGASHIGFWTGPGRMLDTHQPAGVQETNLHAPYWQDHWLGMGRVVSDT